MVEEEGSSVGSHGGGGLAFESYPTLCDPLLGTPLGPSVHEIS